MAPVVTARHNVTFAELSTWPDDGRRYELYDGEVSVVPLRFRATSWRHSNSTICFTRMPRRTARW